MLRSHFLVKNLSEYYFFWVSQYTITFFGSSNAGLAYFLCLEFVKSLRMEKNKVYAQNSIYFLPFADKKLNNHKSIQKEIMNSNN